MYRCYCWGQCPWEVRSISIGWSNSYCLPQRSRSITVNLFQHSTRWVTNHMNTNSNISCLKIALSAKQLVAAIIPQCSVCVPTQTLSCEYVHTSTLLCPSVSIDDTFAGTYVIYNIVCVCRCMFVSVWMCIYTVGVFCVCVCVCVCVCLCVSVCPYVPGSDGERKQYCLISQP